MNSTVLIHGETGTARLLIARPSTATAPARSAFRRVQLRPIPNRSPNPSSSATPRAPFTGAVAARVGRFELAHRGTLFIDEIGLMSLALQSKLLRALQEREIQRVGESRPIKFDTPASSPRPTPISRMVKEGRSREDLYYRLNVIPITLPPLRDRREDIPLLARHSCRSRAAARPAQKSLTQDAVHVLMNTWPGDPPARSRTRIEHA